MRSWVSPTSYRWIKLYHVQFRYVPVKHGRLSVRFVPNRLSVPVHRAFGFIFVCSGHLLGFGGCFGMLILRRRDIPGEPRPIELHQLRLGAVLHVNWEFLF